MSDPYEIGWLFANLNAFFASVEQELRPELRGQPIGIVPIEAETACCIAASYQAKAYGVKTGLRLDEALLLCPHLIVVQARPRLYVEYHHLIVAAIERCIPVQAVMSCDEFACQLMGRERHLLRAVEIAYSIKAELRTVGSTLRCSIGLAPNRLLAKVAGDMTKPDGLMIFERRHLPRALYGLKLGDIPGIGGRMEERVRAEGISTMRELCALPRERMHYIWGSVLGDRLWHWFRGVDFLEPAPKLLQSLSRQHILPPDCRTPERARGIAIKLLHSTARKMRRHGLWRAAFRCGLASTTLLHLKGRCASHSAKMLTRFRAMSLFSGSEYRFALLRTSPSSSHIWIQRPYLICSHLSLTAQTAEREQQKHSMP